ncbi:MAG TPA: hypothetical protein VMF11_04230 [Candidatus Baltobacteraceae bacterium]|nr:hypothetical protein [Candidatus Baltobacteraceae bacterium]
MTFDNDDALDAALFALPLEEPPADLRAAILTATVYRPAPLFSPRELIFLGVMCALVIWLVALVIMGGGSLFAYSLQALGAGTQRALSDQTLLAWVAAGGATAVWLSIFTGFQPRTQGKAADRR